MAIHQCRTCPEDAEFFCLDCHTFTCFSCLFVTRYTYNAPCTALRRQMNHGYHMFVALVPERGYRVVKAATPEQAKKEGRKFAMLMSKLFVRQAEVDFEDVSEFCQYFAMEVLGYRDAEICNNWVRGAMAVFLKSATTEELTEGYANGAISLEQFQRMLQRALQPPKPAQSEEP